MTKNDKNRITRNGDTGAPAPFLKAPTIHDVAAALGMHKSTVSLALSGKGNVSAATRERVLKTATAMGYQPHPLAQRLANGTESSLVCLCSGGLDVGLATEKVLLIQRELGKTSLEVPIYTFTESADGSESQASQIRRLCRQRPRAIVCAAQMLGEASFRELATYQQRGGIVVSYDVPIPLECDQVIFDREDNAYQAARHLIENGHRRIGIGLSNATSGTGDEMTLPQGLRLQGFCRALEEAGLEVRDEWIFQNTAYEIGGTEMAQRFLQMPQRPTGLCIVNDYVILAFMVEVMRAGLEVPRDVSIVGHDNQPVAEYCPVPLTSVSQPVESIANAVCRMLIERLNNSHEPPRTEIIRGDLVARQSVRPPNAVASHEAA